MCLLAAFGSSLLGSLLRGAWRGRCKRVCVEAIAVATGGGVVRRGEGEAVGRRGDGAEVDVGGREARLGV